MIDAGGGDFIAALVAHVLHTPIPAVRSMPVGLLMRMFRQAKSIARQKAS